MKPGEIRDKTLNELEKLEGELEDDLFKLKFRHATGQLQQTSNLKRARRDLARVKTMIREKGQRVAK